MLAGRVLRVTINTVTAVAMISRTAFNQPADATQNVEYRIVIQRTDKMMILPFSGIPDFPCAALIYVPKMR